MYHVYCLYLTHSLPLFLPAPAVREVACWHPLFPFLFPSSESSTVGNNCPLCPSQYTSLIGPSNTRLREASLGANCCFMQRDFGLMVKVRDAVCCGSQLNTQMLESPAYIAYTHTYIIHLRSCIDCICLLLPKILETNNILTVFNFIF